MIIEAQRPTAGPAAATQTYAAPPRWQTDPARVERIGVWCGRKLYVFDHADPRQGCVRLWGEWPAYETQESDDLDLADVARVAARASCAAVWLVPAEGVTIGGHDPNWLRGWSVHARLAMARSAQVFTWHEISANRGTALGGLVAQRIGPDGRGHGVPIGIYATWIDAWPICAALHGVTCSEKRAEAVAVGVALAAYTLGAQLRFSPSYTGLQLLREVLAAKTYGIPPLGEEWAALLTPCLPSPIQWRRPFLAPRQTIPPPRSAIYVRKYDRIFSYIASAREVPVGAPQPTTQYVPGVPGVYQITADAPSNYPRYAPGFFRVGAPGTAGDYPHRVQAVWAWEPQIRGAMALGWYMQVHQGYFWPHAQKHDLLRVWRDRVWQARCAAEAYPGPSGLIAKRIVKKIGVATVGRLKQNKGHKLVSIEEARRHGWAIESRDVDVRGRLTGLVEVEAELGRSDLLHPHWWATIISGANERLITTIMTYAPDDAILGYVDAFYTLGDHAELVGGVQLGKWRQQAIYRLAGGDLGTVDGLSAQSLVKWLVHNGHARMHGDSETDPEAADEEESE